MDTAFSLDPKLDRHTSLNSSLHPSTMLPKAQLMKEHAYYKKFFEEHQHKAEQKLKTNSSIDIGFLFASPLIYKDFDPMRA